MQQWVLWLIGTGLAAGAGCSAPVFTSNKPFLTPDRKANGLVIILPGIEGKSTYNLHIRKGLIEAGVFRAMPIYSWGRPIPLAGPLLNQMDFIGNRLAGVKIAKMILAYQDQYPGRPVHLVGHSGGGGVAVFAAEAMPPGRKVDGLVLLSASLSSTYDLTKALTRCRNGIVNFYNTADAALLGVGTMIVGNVDGVRGPSAGLRGFTRSFPGLYGVRLTSGMTQGELDAHGSTTRPDFVTGHVSPWILADGWPASGQRVALRP